MRQSNKGRWETDCALGCRLIQVFKFETPREPGAHDQIRQDEDRAAGFSFEVIWVKRRGELQTLI